MSKYFFTFSIILYTCVYSFSQNYMIIHLNNGSKPYFTVADVDSITYSNQLPGCPAIFTDSRDGEVYTALEIGTQCWMTQNLRYDIPTSTNDRINPANPNSNYGRLYTFPDLMNGASTSSSVPSGVQGVCPNGWHIPSRGEWSLLEIQLGLSPAAAGNTGYRGSHGDAMRSTTGWSSNNGTNSSGFNVFPAGGYYAGGGILFHDFGDRSYIWTSEDSFREFDKSQVGVGNNSNQGIGSLSYSCRCVRD